MSVGINAGVQAIEVGRTGWFRRSRKVETVPWDEFMQGEARYQERQTGRTDGAFTGKSLFPVMMAPATGAGLAAVSATHVFASPVAPNPVMPVVPPTTPEMIPVMAGDPGMHAKMMSAFAPIIELVQSLAYPVALLVVLGGGLFVMIGNSEKGFSLIQRAALGYVLVMMLPMLLDVLVDAMKSVV